MSDATAEYDRTTHLILQQAQWLRRLAGTLTKSDADADDLLQETLLRAVVHRTRFEEGTSMRAWSKTILKRVWLTDLASRRRRRTSVDTDMGDVLIGRPGQESSRFLERGSYEDFLESLSDDLKQAFERLPEMYRRPLYLFAVEGRSILEIARDLRLPEGTVMSRIHRARQRMKRVMAAPRRRESLHVSAA